MMKKTIVNLFISILLFCWGCSYKEDRKEEAKGPIHEVLLQQKHKDTIQEIIITFEKLHQCIGLPLDSLKQINNLSRKVETIEGDEGFTWNAVKYYKDYKPWIIFETNWENTTKIYRVTIISSEIKFDNLYVGQKFKEIEGIFSHKVPTTQDGLLFLKLKRLSYVNIEFDISESQYKKLYYGVQSLDEVPSNLRVKSIVIF